MYDFERSKLMPILADLLMGAAYADKHFDGREGAVVRDKLRTFLELEELPGELEARLTAFDPSSFDLESTATMLRSESSDRQRKILDLVAAVHDADEELDLDEDTYLATLASCMGLRESRYEDLKLEILSVEDLRVGMRELVQPPPIPKD